MTSARVALGVMARAPVAGRCKTRLARALGDGAAAALYRAMLLDSLDAYGRVRASRHVVLAAPEEDGVAALRAIVPPAWEIVPQVGDGLGARLAQAMRALGATGDAIVLASSDSPTIQADVVDAALVELAAPGRAILGPCEDGGYYLIGVSGLELGVLEGIAWSTSAVLAQTRARCRELGLGVTELPATFDVDEPDDVRTLEAFVRVHPTRAPRVAAFFRGAT
jgi:rSAM/selenodomain-associated transferase 1